jgi:hypothetical protein
VAPCCTSRSTAWPSVAGDAAKSIAAAALERKAELADRDRLTAGRISNRQQLGDSLHSKLDRLCHPTLILNTDIGREAHLAKPLSLGLKQCLKLICLTAKPNKHEASHIGVSCKTGHHTLEELDLPAAAPGAAPAFVGQANNIGDMGKPGQQLGASTGRNGSDSMGRTVYRPKHRNSVSRPGAPLSSAVPKKGPLLWGRGNRADIGAELILHMHLTHREVVRVHMLARPDIARGIANKLPIAQHRLPLSEGPERKLVPCPDWSGQPNRDIAKLHKPLRAHRHKRNTDIVIGMHSNRRCVLNRNTHGDLLVSSP